MSVLTSITAALSGLSLPSALELYQLLHGQRRLVRFGVAADDAADTAGTLRRFGLSVHVWSKGLLPEARSAIDSFHVGGRIVAASEAGARRILFVARDPESLADIESIAAHDWFLGIALGYPLCCVEAFERQSRELSRGYESWFVGQTGSLPYWTNVLCEVFGWVLVSHLPCSPSCEATREMAARHLELLLEDEPVLAARMVAELRSVVFHHPRHGILQVRGDHWTAAAAEAATYRATSGWRRALGDVPAIRVTIEGARAWIEAARSRSEARILDFTGPAC